MKKNLYRVRTTFIGADAPSEFYFDNIKSAENYLSTLVNGEIEAVTIKADYPLNYSQGCTLADLTYGNFDCKITIRKEA